MMAADTALSSEDWAEVVLGDYTFYQLHTSSQGLYHVQVCQSASLVEVVEDPAQVHASQEWGLHDLGRPYIRQDRFH